MSPTRAWQLLMFEFNVHPYSIPEAVPELCAMAEELNAQRLVDKGVYPRCYRGPEDDPPQSGEERL